MESCHSYIHDMLRYLNSPNQAVIQNQFSTSFLFRHLGPTHATDPILLHEINKFPDEAKVGFLNHGILYAEIIFKPYLQKIIQKCGGYRNFILRSKVSGESTVADETFGFQLFVF